MRLGKTVCNNFLECATSVEKVLLFVYHNFQTHKFRIRSSHYFFILETPLNALVENSVKTCSQRLPYSNIGKVLPFRVSHLSNSQFLHSKFALLFYFRGPTKCLQVESSENSFLQRVLALAKCFLFVYDNLQTHNFRIRNSHCSFILEAPVIAPLNAIV